MYNIEGQLSVRIAYIGGGSLNWALTLMADLAWDPRLSANVKLYDIDHQAAHRNAAIGKRFESVSNGQASHFDVSDTLEDALRDADVVVVSILPGDFTDMEADIDIPAGYGIPQAVGDTVGPGGFVRALRAIPELYSIGKAIQQYAPDAYVCNLTNPLSVLTGALYAAYPDIKAWGECHEVTKIRHQVACLANQTQDFDNEIEHRDVQVNVLGINHFTFVDKIFVHGQNYWDKYLKFASEHQDTGWYQTKHGEDEEHRRYFSTRNRVAFDLLSKYGIAAAAGDRHLAEFFPVNEYLHDPARWGFALTPVAYRIKDRQLKRQYAAELAAGEHAVSVSRSDEALIDQIVALMGGASFVSNVNLPNTGQISNLPAQSIVETNAEFSSDGIKPLQAGCIPEESLSDMMNDHAQRQTALLNAVVHGETENLLPLFRSDPLLRDLSTAQSETLYKEMLSATKHCLPTALQMAG